MERTKIKKVSFLSNTKLWLVLIVTVASFLRLWKLGTVPVSLFGDELDVGYQAYSVLKTGKDYSGNTWPIHFQSLAEWRTPLYLYSVVPTVALFGITPYGVRLPAALFGIATIPALYLLTRKITRSSKISLLSSFLLSFSPWHLEYSRAGFEVTQLIFFLVLGLYLFLESLENKGRRLWMAIVCFALTPWIYSTAKLYMPLLLIVLFIIYWREILKLARRELLFAVVAGIVVGAPIVYSTFFGGGTARFDYIGIFTDPTNEPEIGTARGEDAVMRGETGTGLAPTFVDRFFHNKITLLGDKFLKNYLMAYSGDFLFITGDPNPRHSIEGIGELYKVEMVGLLAGVSFFWTKKQTSKDKFLIGSALLLGAIPAALTRDGGNHATRLILLLPFLIILVSVGFVYIFQSLRFRRAKYCFTFLVLLFYLFSYLTYSHLYWVHNPLQSERWWHFGWQEAIQTAVQDSSGYDRVVITTADEPPWIFFAAYSMYDPAKWHDGYPFKKVDLAGFGQISFIGKYYFGSPGGRAGLYDWGKILDSKTLYVASAKEVNVNLILEPNRLPVDLKLIKAIAYPSREPAFYLFTGVR